MFSLGDNTPLISNWLCQKFKSVIAAVANLLSKVIGNYRGDTIDESQQRLQCASNDKRIMYQIEKLKESTRILNYSICVSRNLELLIEKQTGGVLKNNFIVVTTHNSICNPCGLHEF